MESEVDGAAVGVECGCSDQLRGALRLGTSAVESHVRLLAEYGAMICGNGIGNCGLITVKDGEVTAQEAVAVDVKDVAAGALLQGLLGRMRQDLLKALGLDRLESGFGFRFLGRV